VQILQIEVSEITMAHNSEPKLRSALITGGAGYVGSVVVRHFLKENWRVTCLDNLRFGGESLLSFWENPRFTFAKCDLTNFADVARIFERGQFDAVIHLAAIVGDPACKNEPELASRVNYDASINLIKTCQAQGIPRFVFASTCSNYGKMLSNGFVDEESPLAPVSLYAELKVKVEKYILEELPRIDTFAPTCLRFSTVFGISPRMRFDLTVNEFTKDLACGKELVVFGEQFWRPYCHVEDFARAIAAVIDAPREKIAYNVFNVGDTTQNYTKKMIVEMLRQQFPDACVKYVQRSEDPRDYRVNFSKIAGTLGFKISKNVPDGIKEMLEVVKMGLIQDPEDQKYYNIPH
jgi:nucleoside-diphosphate-sugar epimerase